MATKSTATIFVRDGRAHVGDQVIPLASAWLCLDCEHVTDSSRACPTCAGTNRMPLSRWLGRVVEGVA